MFDTIKIVWNEMGTTDKVLMLFSHVSLAVGLASLVSFAYAIAVA